MTLNLLTYSIQRYDQPCWPVASGENGLIQPGFVRRAEITSGDQHRQDFCFDLRKLFLARPSAFCFFSGQKFCIWFFGGGF